MKLGRTNQNNAELSLSPIKIIFLLLLNYKMGSMDCHILINDNFFFRSGLRKGLGMQRLFHTTSIHTTGTAVRTDIFLSQKKRFLAFVVYTARIIKNRLL